MKKAILAGLFFALFTFITAAALSISNISAQREVNLERSHAFSIIRTLESLVDSVMDAETAWSNYTRIRDPHDLDAYSSAINETIKRREELKNIYSGSHFRGRFQDLFVLINSRIEILNELLDFSTKEAGPATEVEVLRREEQIHNALIQAVQDLEKKETEEVAAFDAKIERLSKQSIYSLMAGALLSVITFCGLFYFLYRELQERKRLEQAIKRQAHHDSLTGLPNRLSFMERLDYEIRNANRSRERLAVVFLDVDRFKDINDSLGHEAGDRLLKEVAGRLRASVRESDSVARIGGDEFNILLTNIADADSVSVIAGKVIRSFHQPFAISGREIHSSASAGISLYPEDGENSGALLKNADIAMYHAKEQGRNNFKFYNASLNSRIQERVRIENDIRHILEKNELVLHYQPRIDIRKQRIVSAEALVRWRHPEKGLLAPLQFIPLAEGIGFISSLDEWVLRTACAQVNAWRGGGNGAISLSVNISPREFKRPGLAGVISGILAETGFDPRSLELEIREQAAMENIETTSARLSELAKLGVGLSIDRFGSGYSSLNDLKRLSPSRIKIDRSFIRGIDSSRKDRAIIKAIIVMAHDMDITAVAEGVETWEQMRFLEEIGCDEVQGYQVCGPVPVEEFGRFAASYGSLAA